MKLGMGVSVFLASGQVSGFEILLRLGLGLVAIGLGLMKFGSGQTWVKFFSHFSVNVD